MNKIVKITVLALLAMATVATSIQFADAGERYWRKHGGPWHKRVVVVAPASRFVIAPRPRVVYHAAPLIVDEGPVYDRETIYDDDRTVYADPDEGYGDRVYRDDAPEADYATPRYDNRDDDDDQAYSDGSATEDDYFPERPAARAERKNTETIRKQATMETAPRKQVKKTQTVKEADAAGLKPWTKEWRDWCSNKFSTFNPQNGTYLGYDQKRHFCKAG